MKGSIQNEIIDVNWNDPTQVIAFYERNQIYFLNTTFNDNENEIEQITDIKISYVLALDARKYYSKAEPILKEIDILLQKIKSSKDFQRINERYLFAYGVIARRLKRVEESQNYFTQLIKIDSENELYKEWYESNKEQIQSKNLMFIGYFGLALNISILIGSIFFDVAEDLFNKVTLISLILMVVGFFGINIKNFFYKIWKKG